jgi:hypothetical protein
MNLYINGDSHTQGIGISFEPNENKFANLVAKNFNANLINQATLGASNDKIIRTTKEFLETNPNPDLIIIGWAVWEREEWLYDDVYYQVNSAGHTGLPDYAIDRFNKWIETQTPESLTKKSHVEHEKIYQLHTELLNKKIPHLFFNSMYNFFNIVNEYNWNNSFLEPYKTEYSMYWYLKNLGFESDDWYHHRTEANAVWADLLINYIKQHNII